MNCNLHCAEYYQVFANESRAMEWPGTRTHVCRQHRVGWFNQEEGITMIFCVCSVSIGVELGGTEFHYLFFPDGIHIWVWPDFDLKFQVIWCFIGCIDYYKQFLSMRGPVQAPICLFICTRTARGPLRTVPWPRCVGVPPVHFSKF